MVFVWYVVCTLCNNKHILPGVYQYKIKFFDLCSIVGLHCLKSKKTICNRNIWLRVHSEIFLI